MERFPEVLLDDDISVAAVEAGRGRSIKSLAMTEEHLCISFGDGHTLLLGDCQQYCCESRYMTCDDDLSPFVGASLLSVEVRDVGISEVPETDGYHEERVLVVTTSAGAFTVCTHNEHNGYYGGFVLKAVFE